MKNIIRKFKRLTLSRKVQIIVAMVFTIAIMVAIPVYAWFTNQKKAAEMFKVAYPNALYINAAHREDQVYFALDGININEYVMDANGDTVTVNNEPVKITEKRYVFSVSGANTNQFILQMAHTNNNLFTYKIYMASEETKEPTSGTYVKYTATDVHNENKMVFLGDNVSEGDDLFYVKGPEVTNELGGVSDVGYKNMSSGSKIANGSGDNYYYKTYGDNTNVEEHAVPSYWQATINADQQSNKQFCKYFILEVTWNYAEQSNQTAKESDLVYFSVQRKN